MRQRQYALIGLFIPIIFWSTYLMMSSLRPEFSFMTKAISELGTIEAPNKWFWNFFGYILTGLLISIYSYGLFKTISPRAGNKLPLIGFILSGLFMSLSGIFPADMDNRESTSSILHNTGSIGSYIFFLVGAFAYPRQMKKTAYWTRAVRPTLLFTWLTIIFGGWYFIFPNMPGVGQRIVFFFYLLWFLYTAWRLYKQSMTSAVNS